MAQIGANKLCLQSQVLYPLNHGTLPPCQVKLHCPNSSIWQNNCLAYTWTQSYKPFLASIEATLKLKPIREATIGRMTDVIGQIPA